MHLNEKINLSNKINWESISLKVEDRKPFSDYKKKLEFIQENDLYQTFPNSGCEKAAWVLGTIFNKANFNLKIFLGNFTSLVVKDVNYLSNLELFLKKDHTKLEIICEGEPEINSDVFKLISKYKKFKYIKLFKLIETDILKEIKLSAHFTIGDSTMLRYEFDKNDYKAFCSYYAPNEVRKLTRTFDILINHSIPVF